MKIISRVLKFLLVEFFFSSKMSWAEQTLKLKDLKLIIDVNDEQVCVLYCIIFLLNVKMQFWWLLDIIEHSKVVNFSAHFHYKSWCGSKNLRWWSSFSSSRSIWFCLCMVDSLSFVIINIQNHKRFESTWDSVECLQFQSVLMRFQYRISISRLTKKKEIIEKNV